MQSNFEKVTGYMCKKCPEPIVIPIVFVPGMMGSRLKNSNTRENIWDPKFNTGWLWQWSGIGGKKRRKILIGKSGKAFNGNYLAVDFGTLDYLRGKAKEHNLVEAHERGWGGVAWDFYGNFLNWLDQNLKDQLPNFAVGCSNINFEVWAHPYNWTDDNINAAKSLKMVVTNAHKSAVGSYKDETDTKVLKPIVITHSMGGLVARAFSILEEGQPLIHTVIHGAMPTYGSPAAYKRMRAGFEGVTTSTVLGSNSSSVTAMLANSPGGLQLLPSQFHVSTDGNKEWLKVTFKESGDVLSLPKSDPYEEIYSKKTEWWRLVDPEYIDPDSNDLESSWDEYLINLKRASYFHSDLGKDGFHQPTKMFYCASPTNYTWDKTEWKVANFKDIKQEDLDVALKLVKSNELPHYDNGKGKLEFLIRKSRPLRRVGLVKKDTVKVKIQAADAAGDGTVHAGSGIKNYLPSLVISNPTLDNLKEPVSYGHDAAFDSTEARQQVAKWVSEIIVEESKA